MSQEFILSIRELNATYPGQLDGRDVLRGISLDVASGESVAVMGPSGSGKSTLLNCAAGLLPARTGSISVDGLEITSASEKQLTKLRRDRLGFVFQDFNLVPALTAEQNVGLAARFSGHPRARAKNLEALAAVGLRDKANAHPERLSGGQRQRVAIARALVSEPAVVFADEPTGSLDAGSGAQVLRLLYSLVELGTGMLIVTHDPNMAALAGRVVLLFDGTLVDELSSQDAGSIASRLAELEATAS